MHKTRKRKVNEYIHLFSFFIHRIYMYVMHLKPRSENAIQESFGTWRALGMLWLLTTLKKASVAMEREREKTCLQNVLYTSCDSFVILGMHALGTFTSKVTIAHYAVHLIWKPYMCILVNLIILERDNK